MEPIDERAAAVVTRHTSPDGRTVLDLVWAYAPDDFRELGGEQRPNVYDAATGEIVLNLLWRNCAVAGFTWADNGALDVDMQSGEHLRISVADGTYSSSADISVPRRLSDVNAQEMLARQAQIDARAPERESWSAPWRWQKYGWYLLAAGLVFSTIAIIASGNGHIRYIRIPSVH